MAQVKVKILDDYQNRTVSYKKGEEIQVDEAEAKRLKADSPGCFKVIGGKEISEAPEDKMIEEAPRNKMLDEESLFTR